mgnify:CR=1 FL=1
MKTTVLFLFCMFAALQPLFPQSQENTSDRGSRLLFPPLRAHHLEPRVGMSRLVEEERLRLDIGNSIDVYRWNDVLAGAAVSVGVDFFTWTSLRQEKDFHFPVDAVDYLFGINAAYRRPLAADVVLFARLRLSHISAHLVDGSYIRAERRWRDDQQPRVYSREFIDVVLAAELQQWLRIYAGGKYIYHIDPAELGTWSPQTGVEAVWRDAANLAVHPYAAVDVRFVEVNAWSTAVNLQLGVVLGRWRGAGLDLFVAYYHGMSQHGEYYDRLWSYWGPGFNVTF